MVTNTLAVLIGFLVVAWLLWPFRVLLHRGDNVLYRIAAEAHAIGHPVFWVLTRHSDGLQSDLSTVRGILLLEGMPHAAMRIREMRRPVIAEDARAMIFSFSRCPNQLILVASDVVQSEPAVRLYVVGHEVGHYIEDATGRRGHPLFDLLPATLNSERFADAFSWYCLEYCRTVGQGFLFDWQAFRMTLARVVQDCE